MANSGLVVPNFVVVQSAVSTAGATDTTTAASNVGLIALLPLIGAVLGGVVGGVIGAWANSWYRNREAKKARKQELEGLMILLSTEVRSNNIALKNFLERTPAQPDSDKRTLFAVADFLHSVVWDESRARLAQLLPSTTEVAKLALYYMILEELRSTSTGARGEVSEDYTKAVRSLKEAGISVLKVAQRYISDPELAAILSLDEDG